MWKLVALLLIGQAETPQPPYAETMHRVHADLATTNEYLRRDYRYIIRPRFWDEKTWAELRPALIGNLNQVSKQSVLYPLNSDAMVPLGNSLLRINVRKLDYKEQWDRLRDAYFTERAYESIYEQTEAKQEVTKVQKTFTHNGGDFVYPKGAFSRQEGTEKFFRTEGQIARNLPPGDYTYWVEETKGTPSEKRLVGKGDKLTNAPAQILMESFADEALVNQIYEWTGSRAAMCRADWLANQILASQDRDPGYVDFLGIKDEDSYHKLIGFDDKLAKGFRFELRDATGQSGVALSHVRAIVRKDTLGNGLWETLDFENPKDAHHPLRTVGRDIEKFYDAKESYGFLPNGFFALGAFKGPGKDGQNKDKGALQRRVPTSIAADNASSSNNKNIEVGISCIRCHGKGGLQPVDTFFRNLLVPPLKGNIVNYNEGSKNLSQDELEKLELELRQEYEREFKGVLEDDKARYDRTVLICTGLTSEEYAKKTSELWQRYEDAKVDTKYAAAEFGLTEDEFREKLLAVIKASEQNNGYPRIDPLVGGFVHSGAKAMVISIRDWESVYSQAYGLIVKTEIKGKNKKPAEE